MQKIPSEINNYISSIQRIEILQNQALLYTNDGIYIYIPSCSSKEIYSYLLEIGFLNIYSLINHFDDSFQLIQVDGERNKERLFLLEEYYLKSSKMVSFDNKIVSKIYEKCLHRFHHTYQFYFDVQNRIEEMYFPRKPFYFLLLQMSDIYHLLSLGEYFLKEWIQLNPTEYRDVLILRKIDSNNFWGNKIVDVSSSRRDYYIYELANYYSMYFEEDSILDEINQFMDSFPITKEDMLLFYALISNVEEFDLEGFESEEKIIKYVSKTSSFLLEKNKEYQETKEEMLKEQ